MSENQPLNPSEFTVVLENIVSKIDLVVEAITPIPQLQQDVQQIKGTMVSMQNTLDATFEEVGRLREDSEEIKEKVGRHEQQLRSSK